MYYPIKNGSVEVIEIDGGDGIGIVKYNCQLPPVGYGKNRITGEIEHVGVRSASPKKENQVWKRIELPSDWLLRRKKETAKQAIDPEFFDPELEKIRNKFWLHRLCGEWIKINGVDTYIPPQFWVYLNVCPLDTGYPFYRSTDKKLYYVWEYCCEDPYCGGLVDIERRRAGKTFKSGSIALDRASINSNHHSGIQSKTGPDAKAVFARTIISFFKKWPDFFRPVFDQGSGATPTTSLRFFQTTKKGKRATEVFEGEELESWIDFGSSDPHYYDGFKLNTYVQDEFGKTKECDTYDRWNIVRFCLDQDGQWIGKSLHTTTVEEMESGGAAARKMWYASNPNKRNANGRTESGCYIFFLPAYETTFFDKFGNSEIEKGVEFYNNERKGVSPGSKELASLKRKNPFNINEAFYIDGEKCHFNPTILNDRREYLSYAKPTERGNFVWKNGVPYSEVEWVKDSSGRWEISWVFPDANMCNAVEKVGNLYYPKNKIQLISACDPYQNDITEDMRNSLAASHVFLRFDRTDATSPNNRAFICQYHSRPRMVTLFYEDMIKQCFYYGTQILYESNKPGIKQYFIDKGFENFLIRIPGYKDYGIPSTQENKKLMVNIMEEYVENQGSNIMFVNLCKQLLEFDVDKTQKFDLVMSAGWTLVADFYRRNKLAEKASISITDLFREYSTN